MNRPASSSLALLGFVGALLVGCGPTVGVTRMSATAYPRLPSDCPVQIFSSPPTDRKLEELALLDVATGQTIFDGKDLEAMLPSLRKETCRLGGDGLIVRNVEPGGTPWVHATQGKASAVAIKLTAP